MKNKVNKSAVFNFHKKIIAVKKGGGVRFATVRVPNLKFKKQNNEREIGQHMVQQRLY